MSRRGPILGIVGLVLAATAGCGVPTRGEPACDRTGPLTLIAQSVPSATVLPCLAELPLPPGWTLASATSETGRTMFVFDSDRAGMGSVSVELTTGCDPVGTEQATPAVDGIPVRSFEQVLVESPYAGRRYYTFPGGCVTFAFSFGPGGSFAQAVEATQFVRLTSRSALAATLSEAGLTLCGAGADCPG